MAEPDDKARGADRPAGAQSEREARLAKALRDNLRRRKAPARPGPEPQGER